MSIACMQLVHWPIFTFVKNCIHVSFFPLQATIARNAKDTAHTKAERNILECVKVSNFYNIEVSHLFFYTNVN